jgi:pSer/pThr/pTyr-binding forkhead associated (FHA) protein
MTSATKPILARIIARDNSEISVIGSRKFGRDDFRNMVPDEKLPFISRQHFRIAVSGDRYYIEDLQSNNGTTLNGERLQPGSQRELRKGDEICCADVLRLKFQV